MSEADIHQDVERVVRKIQADASSHQGKCTIEIRQTAPTIADRERAAIVAYLDRLRDEASELAMPDAIFWIVQIKRDIMRGEHLKHADAQTEGKLA